MREGDVVDVYWNATRNVASLRFQGKVATHAESVALLEPVFIVRERGRQRVLATRHKNVHAFVRGRLTTNLMSLDELVEVRYNPYRGNAFVDPHGRAVESAEVAVVTRGRVLAFGVRLAGAQSTHVVQ